MFRTSVASNAFAVSRVGVLLLAPLAEDMFLLPGSTSKGLLVSSER
jgi:hypothetical protein